MAFVPILHILEDVEEEDNNRGNAIILRYLRNEINAFNMPNNQFIKMFRLSKEAVSYLCDVLNNSLRRTRSNGLSVQTQILAALRFFAIGSYQKGIGNDYFVSLSQPAASRAIRAVAQAVTKILANEWIRFPTTQEERAALKRRFQEERNFKGVIGCIDCTHVAIIKPKIQGEQYANYKGFHSINVQTVASQDLKILSINARFPGMVRDNFIWKYSAVRDEMIRLYENGDRSTWLLGDSDYCLEPWLMTPIANAPEGSAEARYTQCHTSTRNCVERTFEVLKNVWRCLLGHRVLHYKPITAAYIITACATLHNIRLHYNLMDGEVDIDEEGETVALQRARMADNILARERIKKQFEEINGVDEMYFDFNRLTEAERIQRRILQTQFSLHHEE